MPTFVADEIVTAVKLNAGTVRDWTTWVPTLTLLNVGSTGTVTARYCLLGTGTVFFDIHVTLGGTGISVGDCTFTVPVAENAGYNSGTDDRIQVGEATFVDAATAIYPGAVTVDDGVLRPRAYSIPATYLLQATLTSTIPFTWVTGDRMWLHGWYETA